MSLEWSDEGIILGVRRHGESAAILEILTQQHGRYLGLVHGGQSRKLRPVLQTGNSVAVNWRARLSEQLGTFSAEIMKSNAAIVIQDKMALAGLNTVCNLARLLPEREQQIGLYEAMTVILDRLQLTEVWPGLLVRWELELLKELGLGLDLERCVVTGSRSELVYVSPRSGCAVSKSAGEPYHDKLLNLPGFLSREKHSKVTAEDILCGLELTGFFLQNRVLEARKLKIPEARRRLVSYLESNLGADN